MKTQKTKKNQKPISIDAHFKYRCPDRNCNYEHWLSLKEAQTKNFKIVCDCGNVFRPQRIKRLGIIFYKKKQVVEEQIIPPTKEINTSQKLDIAILRSVVKILVGHGFTETESVDLCEKGFIKNPCNDSLLLARYILQNIGELNECN